MIDVNMPLFDIKATEELIIIAGGGGSKDFGVENGVTVLLKDSQEKKVFHETEDIITAVEVYECDSEEENSIEESNENEADISKADGSSEEKESSESEISTIEHSENEEDKTKKHRKSAKKNIDVELLKDIRRRNVGDAENESVDQSRETSPKSKGSESSDDFPATRKVIIAAIGENFLHVLKFDGKFHSLSKIRKGVKKVILSKNMIVLADNKIYGFYDVEHNPHLTIPRKGTSAKISEADISRVEEEDKSITEEPNIFKLAKRHNKVVCMDVSVPNAATPDLSTNWDNFFINGSEIHKVIYKGNQSTFTYDDCDAEVSGKISKIMCESKILVFYSHHDKKSNLNINGRDITMEKITALAMHENIVAVSTVSGSIVFFENGKKSSEMKVSDLPITGIAIDKKKIHFTILNGVMGTVNTRKMRGFNIFVMFVLIFMLIGVLIDFLYNKKQKEISY